MTAKKYHAILAARKTVMFRMKLSFSTLGCTEKSLAESLMLAKVYGLDGIEVRGLSGTMDNACIRELQPGCLAATKRLLGKSGIAPVVLGTSCKFHTAEMAEAAMEEGMNSILIAQRLNIPYVRVFGNDLTDDREACIARVQDGIAKLCSFAGEHGVTVLLEVHGGFNTVETLTPIARALNGKHFGLIWDIGHTHAPYGDDWELFYRAMRPYICHVHIKDKCGSALVLPGEGEIPISAIVRRMLEDGYDGFFSLEWERKWHPELPPLEDALERYVRLMKG